MDTFPYVSFLWRDHPIRSHRQAEIQVGTIRCESNCIHEHRRVSWHVRGALLCLPIRYSSCRVHLVICNRLVDSHQPLLLRGLLKADHE